MPATGHALAWLRSVRLLREASRAGRAHEMAVELERDLFERDRTEVWAVTLPDPFVIRETRDLIDAIARERALPTRVVVNAMPPRVDASAAEQSHTLGLRAISARLSEWTRAAQAAQEFGEILTIPKLPMVRPSVVSEHLRVAL